MGTEEQFLVRWMMFARAYIAALGLGVHSEVPQILCVQRLAMLSRTMTAASCAGITLAPWLRFLADNRTFIDWRPYWHRLLFLTAMATFNSVIAAWEALCHGRAIAQQRLHPEPVFILGHPRTGTTQ